MYLIVTHVLLFVSLSAAVDIPQLELLFPSSNPDLAWSSYDAVSSYPGHNQQLAKHHPRRKVDVAYKRGFPSAADFYSNFVERKRPVVFSEAVSGKEYELLTLKNLNSSTRAALTFTDVSSFKLQEKEKDSLLNFVSSKINKTFYISESLHKNLKTRTILPECLQCSYLVEKLFTTTHTIIGHVFPLPIKQVNSNVDHDTFNNDNIIE